MATPIPNRPYKYLAEFYDRIFVPDTFDIQKAARKEILKSVMPRVQSACDLACGTGTTALSLAKSGLKTFAADNSPGMCRLARAKARRAKVALRVLLADMRSFQLPEQVDLIVCEGDAVNHLGSKAELIRIAKSVSNALHPGGWFYFDVNNRAGFKSYWKGTWWNEKPGLVLAMRNGNDAVNDRAWCDCEWFIRRGRNNWQRRHERVEEVCWSAKEIRETLKQAGFNRIRAWDASPFFNNPLIKPGCRSIYLAQKAS
jgi:SAM-dependent methyltransferase